MAERPQLCSLTCQENAPESAPQFPHLYNRDRDNLCTEPTQRSGEKRPEPPSLPLIKSTDHSARDGGLLWEVLGLPVGQGEVSTNYSGLWHPCQGLHQRKGCLTTGCHHKPGWCYFVTSWRLRPLPQSFQKHTKTPGKPPNPRMWA